LPSVDRRAARWMRRRDGVTCWSSATLAETPAHSSTSVFRNASGPEDVWPRIDTRGVGVTQNVLFVWAHKHGTAVTGFATSRRSPSPLQLWPDEVTVSPAHAKNCAGHFAGPGQTIDGRSQENDLLLVLHENVDDLPKLRLRKVLELASRIEHFPCYLREKIALEKQPASFWSFRHTGEDGSSA
jgi:hypothetical protein